MEIKVLVIAPSEPIKNRFEEARKDFPDLIMDIKVANLANAIALVTNLGDEYDVVIARGETARLVSQHIAIPLVEMQMSGFDVLSAIRQAESLHMPFAVVGYEQMTRSAKRLNEMLGYDLDIYSVSSSEETVDVMKSIKQKGYNLVVCSLGSDHAARYEGLVPIMVMTSNESVYDALKQTLLIGSHVVKSRMAVNFNRKLLTEGEQKMIVYTSDCVLVLNTFSEEETYPVALCEKLLQHKTSRDQTVERLHEGVMYSVRQQSVEVNGSGYIVFTFMTRPMPYIPQRNEIRIFSKDEVFDAFLMHFPQFASSISDDLGVDISSTAKASTPVMLLGEAGTGKEQIAALLYANGNYSNKPYYIIDIETLGDKGWNTLMYGDDSLLVESGLTIYLRHLDKISSQRLQHLKAIVNDSSLEKRIKLIFSCDIIPGTKLPGEIVEFINELGVITIQLKPLRQRRSSDVSTLFAMYINTMDEKYGKNVIGLTAEAERLMLEYQWPDNLLQLRRVLSDLVVNTSSSYIDADLVRRVLEDEKLKLTSSQALSSVIDINKKMSEIEKDVARAVVLKTNGNQSQAAQRLGISRTTLWRLLS